MLVLQNVLIEKNTEYTHQSCTILFVLYPCSASGSVEDNSDDYEDSLLVYSSVHPMTTSDRVRGSRVVECCSFSSSSPEVPGMTLVFSNRKCPCKYPVCQRGGALLYTVKMSYWMMMSESTNPLLKHRNTLSLKHRIDFRCFAYPLTIDLCLF